MPNIYAHPKKLNYLVLKNKATFPILTCIKPNGEMQVGDKIKINKLGYNKNTKGCFNKGINTTTDTLYIIFNESRKMDSALIDESEIEEYLDTTPMKELGLNYVDIKPIYSGNVELSITPEDELKANKKIEKLNGFDYKKDVEDFFRNRP